MNKFLLCASILLFGSCASHDSVVASSEIDRRYLSETNDKGSKELIINLLFPQN